MFGRILPHADGRDTVSSPQAETVIIHDGIAPQLFYRDPCLVPFMAPLSRVTPSRSISLVPCELLVRLEVPREQTW